MVKQSKHSAPLSASQHHYRDVRGSIKQQELERVCEEINKQDVLTYDDEQALFEASATGVYNRFRLRQAHIMALDLRANDELFLAQLGVGPVDSARKQWGIEQGLYTAEAFRVAEIRGRYLRRDTQPADPFTLLEIVFRK